MRRRIRDSRRKRGSAAIAAAAPRAEWGEVVREVLPNGLRVLTARAPGLHSAMIALYVRAGSRHEAAEVNGVSHFLEHLFFRGSEGWPDTVAMNAAIESAGGSLNGITARDHGCYFTPIHPGEVGTGLAILGDLLRRPLLRQMDVEREVILEEILDEVDADGRDIDPDNLSKRIAFGAHPLGFKIAGTAAIVRRLGRRDVRAHHARFYTGANLVLSVAGPVRASEVRALAEEHFGALPRGQRSVEDPAPPWPDGPSWSTRSTPGARISGTWPAPRASPGPSTAWSRPGGPIGWNARWPLWPTATWSSTMATPQPSDSTSGDRSRWCQTESPHPHTARGRTSPLSRWWSSSAPWTTSRTCERSSS
jgi:predicted Zn-dependent peptidase